MKKFLLAIAMLSCFLCAEAAKVDTVWVKSPSMKKNVKVVVVTPDKPGRYPAVYMLHGHGGNARSWVGMFPDALAVADREGFIWVCPDGQNGWYWDSPLTENRYETFCTSELVQYVDAHYPTIADRNHRAVTGWSMGGHGAMYLSMRHTDVFGAAGSMSGGVDIRPFPNNWDMYKQLGREADNRTIWDEHAAINQIDRLKKGDLALIIDCGYDDFFFEVNNRFHEKLLRYKIDHDFYVRPGGHNAAYWRNAIWYHIVFFKEFFKQADRAKP